MTLIRVSCSLAILFLALGCRDGAAGWVEKSRPAIAPIYNRIFAQTKDSPSQASSSAPTTTAPSLPRDYRVKIAILLAAEFVKDGRGPALISDPQSNVAAFGASTRVCVRFPVDFRVLIETPQQTKMRDSEFVANRNVLSGDRVRFLRIRPLYADCTNKGTLRPFVELEQAARQLKACRVKGESKCTFNIQTRRSAVDPSLVGS